MNRLVVPSLAALILISATPISVLAQAPASTTSTGSGGASASTAMKPLASADKKFIKDAAEQVLAVTRLTELTRHQGPGSEELKKLNAKILSDLNKVWGELGTVAGKHKVDLPKTEVSGSDKTQLDKLRKTEEGKFDKALLKSLEKETKKAAQVFEAADKTVQEAELKTVLSNWTPALKNHADEVTKAEAEASKKK